MATNKKVTQREMYEMLLERVTDSELLTDFINLKLSQLDKKANAPRKVSTENEVIKGYILNVLESTQSMTATEIMHQITDNYDLSFMEKSLTNQKVSAILKPMIGKEVTRSEVKKVAYFSLIEG